MRIALGLIGTLWCIATSGQLAAADYQAGARVTSISVLEERALARVAAKPRIALPPDSSPALRGVEPLLPSDKGLIPNFAKAVAGTPDAPAGFARLVKAFLFEGTVEPETKLAMALRMAQANNSPYVAAQVIRLLRATDRGQVLLTALKSGQDSPSPAQQRAIDYSDALTKEVHGLSDAEFQKVRAWYNDSQIVELTLTACLFNYLTRFSEALNLPVEQWALQTPPVSDRQWQKRMARVALVSDAEIAFGDDLVAKAAKNPYNLGPGVIANSLRVMMQAPALAAAFRDYFMAGFGKLTISRETRLQVSFAVSMANGCRYCTLHQVLGLKSLGVDPAKLVAMQKDDQALTPLERSAVIFARKLTREPAGITDTDYASLLNEFGEQGALDVLRTTCVFAFMNRFTDGLRLPSEDAAVQAYIETYHAQPADAFKR